MSVPPLASVTYDDVLAARERLRALPPGSRPLNTPTQSSASLSALAAARHAGVLHRHPLVLLFKGEYANKTGSFKSRGAANAVALVAADGAAAGVCTHSSGNHSAALAWAARSAGLPAHIVMPRGAPASTSGDDGGAAPGSASGGAKPKRTTITACAMLPLTASL